VDEKKIKAGFYFNCDLKCKVRMDEERRKAGRRTGAKRQKVL